MGANVTESPCCPCINSTSITSPGLTFCCFPPALITAYMCASGFARSIKRSAPMVSQLVREEDPTPFARRARLGERLQEPGRDSLSGHLQQPERSDVEHLRSGLVLSHRRRECLVHLVP